LVAALLAGSAQAQDLADDPPGAPPVWQEIQRLRARLDALEARGAAEGDGAQAPSHVDLTDDELPSIRALNGDHVLSRPWYENVDLHGYAALSYIDTGGTGTLPDGSFLVQESSLFLEAQVWEEAFVFTEIFVARYLYDYGDQFTVGELYAQFPHLGGGEDGGGVGLKVGRVDLPFGEDYLRDDAPEAPLVSRAVTDAYGIDEGVLLYGRLGPVGWIGAVTDGSSSFTADDGPSKQLVAKLYGDPTPSTHLSASVLRTGSTEESAFKISGYYFRPVGAGYPSTAGASPSADVDTTAWELDGSVDLPAGGCRLQLGGARVDDDDSTFDRDLTWFQIEPAVRIRDGVHLIVRYSQIGTGSSDEGYLLTGKILTEGQDFGYDTRRLRRLSAGLRWDVQPRIAVKVEVGHDWVDLIDASPFDEENDERLYFAVQIVASF
jgi:hypothetical protein